ncbi:transporter substrate-binding domain-containing protein [Roseibium sp.]|uniref:transporter substrate-binding domain-containing protein n=1 Tax=Roseibium sp. TaxID=1936156 RepID=UPI003A96A3F3
MNLEEIRKTLVPEGVLRAGINMANRLLVSGEMPDGTPFGVSPDVARALAAKLEVPVRFIKYPNPGGVADGAARGEWDIGNIGAEPERAKTIVFTRAYCEIEATYLVRPGSPLTSVADVDRPSVTIAVKARSAYGLWLERNIRYAELVLIPPTEDVFAVFQEKNLDALAGLRTGLARDLSRLPGGMVLDGQFTAVQQAVGTPIANRDAAEWLDTQVAELIASGKIAQFIRDHAVEGLSVPAA